MDGGFYEAFNKTGNGLIGRMAATSDKQTIYFKGWVAGNEKNGIVIDDEQLDSIYCKSWKSDRGEFETNAL